MASNKRDICRQEGEVRGRGEGGGGVFFRKQPRKDKREPPKHELQKIGDGRGGGEMVEGTQNCIKDITGTSSIMCVVCV